MHYAFTHLFQFIQYFDDKKHSSKVPIACTVTNQLYSHCSFYSRSFSASNGLTNRVCEGKLKGAVTKFGWMRESRLATAAWHRRDRQGRPLSVGVIRSSAPLPEDVCSIDTRTIRINRATEYERLRFKLNELNLNHLKTFLFRLDCDLGLLWLHGP